VGFSILIVIIPQEPVQHEQCEPTLCDCVGQDAEHMADVLWRDHEMVNGNTPDTIGQATSDISETE